MKKRSLLILILLMLGCFVPFALADDDYNQTGGFSNYFRQGTGEFDSNSVDYTTKSIAVENNEGTPLVSDLDGDGRNEIIVLDDGHLRLFNSTTFTILDTFNMYDDGYHSNIIAYDYDGDGYTEVIVAWEDQNQRVLEAVQWNGTDFNSTQLGYEGIEAGLSSGETAVQCWGNMSCALIEVSQSSGASAVKYVYVEYFNTTNISISGNPIYTTDASEQPCMPQIRSYPAVDIDEDGKVELVLDFFMADGSIGGTDEEGFLALAVEYQSNNNSFLLDDSYYLRTSDWLGSGEGNDCKDFENPNPDGFIGSYISPPVTFDIDGSSSNGLETVIAFMVNENEFMIISLEGCNGDCSVVGGFEEFDHYPELCCVLGVCGLDCPDGRYISNIVKSDVFFGSEGVDDFCAMGYDIDNEEANFICASETSTWIGAESVEFNTLDMPYNLSWNSDSDYLKQYQAIHTAQHSDVIASGSTKDRPEMVLPFGIYAVENGVLAFGLTELFENPKSNSLLLSVDFEKNGRDDLLAYQDGNLWYINDEWVNSPAYISYAKLDPICDKTIKVNTTLNVEMRVNNQDSAEDSTDRTGARVILYYDAGNEQDTNWTANYTAGTTIEFTGTSDFLVFNKTGTYTLRIMGRDTGNPDTVDYIDTPFVVGTEGVEVGDCYTEINPVNPIEEEEAEEGGGACSIDSDCETGYACIGGVCTLIADLTCTTDDDCPDGYVCVDTTEGTRECKAENLVKRSVQELDSFFHVGSLTLWLILMLGINYLILTKAGEFFKGVESRYVFAGMLFLNLFLIIVGTLISFLPFWILLLLILLGIVSVVLFVANKFQGSQGV